MSSSNSVRCPRMGCLGTLLKLLSSWDTSVVPPIPHLWTLAKEWSLTRFCFLIKANFICGLGTSSMREKCAENAIKYPDKHFPPVLRKIRGQGAGLNTVVSFQRSPDRLNGLCPTFLSAPFPQS